MKKETAMLKKNEQLLNYERVKQKHQENMLKLQAKHFGFDAKNMMNQVSLKATHERNRAIEQGRKGELSINQYGNTYQIKPKKYHDDVVQMMDKIQAMEEGQPKGLKTINKHRQPVVLDQQ